MSKIGKEHLFNLEELTYELLLERVKEKTATASEIAQILKYLGEKGLMMAVDPNEEAADAIMAGADSDDMDLPFTGGVQ